MRVVIGFVVAFVVGLIGLLVRGLRLSGKSADEKQKVLKEMQDQMDKAIEGTNDPNEPARWVT